MALNVQTQVQRMMMAARMMSWHDRRLERSAEQATSGLRLNRAADDAAGLSIAESLRAQVRGNLVAAKNILDGGSLLNVADAAINQIADALHRMRALAVQSANGVYSNQQRQSMENEFLELRREINYVTREASFNGFYLLRGGEPASWSTISRTTSVTYPTTTNSVTITPQIKNVAYGALGTNGLGEQVANLGASVPAVYGLGTAGPESIVLTAFDSGTGTTRTIPYGAANGFTYAAGPNQITFHGAGALSATETLSVHYVPASAATALTLTGTPATGSLGVKVNGVAVAAAGSPAGNGYYMSGNTISLVGSALPDAMGGSVTLSASYLTQEVNSLPLNLESTYFEGGVLDPASLVVKVDGVAIAADPVNGYSIIQQEVDQVGSSTLYSYTIQLNGASQAVGSAPRTISVNYKFDQPAAVDPLKFDIQSGANESMIHTLLLERITSGGLGLAASHIRTQTEAQSVLDDLNRAIGLMTKHRSSIGAYVNALDSSYATVLTAHEQMASAESFIRDADMAAAITDATRSQILRSSAGAMMSNTRSNGSNYLLKLLGA